MCNISEHIMVIKSKNYIPNMEGEMREKQALKLKHFIVRKPRQIKSLDKEPQKLSYTIACKVNKDPALDESAIPGSLEDQLQAPEQYLDVNSSVNAAKVADLSKQSSPDVLNPMDIYKEADLEHKRRQVPPKKQDMPRPKTCFKMGAQKVAEHFSKETTAYMDLQDEDIDTKYKMMNLKSRPYTAAVLSSRVQHSKDFRENQPKFFDSYTATQRRWNGFLRSVCRKVGREVGESVAVRAKDYRERIEKASEFQIKNCSSVTNAAQNWFLSLRNSERSKHYVVPYGNVCTGLF
eukprot:TRINITY_DN2630_c0_g1_i11.p1 TRINITY_DN2630_c0_g1~~TRINITY_DN2630_c0_g1_i11.p1  ORF type:complete len:292 (+),score=67.84 TRINITY_DN2630_c0_g1_i11:114-989(+)